MRASSTAQQSASDLHTVIVNLDLQRGGEPHFVETFFANALTDVKRSSLAHNSLVRLHAYTASTVSSVQRQRHAPDRSLPLGAPLPEGGHSR
jgi:hypothetical protein